MASMLIPTLLWSALLLLLVNVGWSWWFAEHTTISHSFFGMIDDGYAGVSIDPSDERYANIVYRGSAACEIRYWMLRAAKDEEYAPEELDRRRPIWADSFERAAPWWLRRRHAKYQGVFDTGDYQGEAAVLIGWPAPLLWCTWRADPRGWAVTRDTGIEIEPPFAPPPPGSGAIQIHPSFSRAMPFRPVLEGQIIYGVVCVGVVLLVRHGPRAVRRCWRCRAGLCRKCGYDMRELTSNVCPECGTAISLKSEKGSNPRAQIDAPVQT